MTKITTYEVTGVLCLCGTKYIWGQPSKAISCACGAVITYGGNEKFPDAPCIFDIPEGYVIKNEDAGVYTDTIPVEEQNEDL